VINVRKFIGHIVDDSYEWIIVLSHKPTTIYKGVQNPRFKTAGPFKHLGMEMYIMDRVKNSSVHIEQNPITTNSL